MEKPFILHMLTTAKNLSLFDVNMAMDAGWVKLNNLILCLENLGVERW